MIRRRDNIKERVKTRMGPNGEKQELVALKKFTWCGRYIGFRPYADTSMA
jgi:hypothetical protein